MDIYKFDEFASISLSTYNLEDFDFDKKVALKYLAKKHQADFVGLNSKETKKARHQFFDIPNTTENDYKEWIIELSNERKIICGVRHHCGLRDKAFVNIQTNFYVSRNEMKKLYEDYLKEYFDVFDPKFLRYYTKNNLFANEIRKCYMIQNSSVIKEYKQIKEEREIILESPKDEKYYDWYLVEYKKFHEKEQSLSGKVPINDKESMEKSRQNDLLKVATYKGSVIGLIAGSEEPFLGHSGFYFSEILIKDAWKGQGLGKMMQKKYIQEFLKEDTIIWGTIDFENKASLNTAKANLRKAVRFEKFLNLKEVAYKL